MKIRYKIVSLWFAGALLCACAGCQSREAPIAWINDLPVARAEAALFSSSEEDPKELKKGVEKLVWYKLLQGEMAEAGEIKDASYETFLKLLEEENESRKKQEEAGEVLYGPRQYTAKVYYEYLAEQYEAAWRDSISVEADEEELRRIYEENETLYQNFGEVTFQYLSFTGEEAKEDLKRLRNQLSDAVQEGASFTDAVKEAGYETMLEERAFTQEDLDTPDVTGYPEISDLVYRMQAGSVSEVIDLEHQYLIFYCLSRKEGERTPFEECKDALREQYREAYIEELKQEACDQATIRYAEEFQEE